MKKSLIFGAVVLLSFAIAFTSCDQPTDYGLQTENVNSLGAFTLNTRVPAGGGGVLLTWSVQKDATSYEVWRQQTSPQLEEAKQLGTVFRGSLTRYVDVKSATNWLQPGVSYNYQIIAKSNSATDATGLPNEIVQNRSVVRSVRFTDAQLPASINLTPVEGLTLSVTPYLSLLATWTPDANPLIKYKVTYNFGTSSTTYIEVHNTGINSATSSVDGNRIGTILTGVGESTQVKVEKILGDGTFYGSPAAVFSTLSIPQFANVTTTNANFTTTRDSLSIVRVQLPVIATATPSLADYELYRTRIALSGETAQDWTLIDVSSAQLISTSQYEFYDQLPGATVAGDAFRYRLIIKYPESGLVHSLIHNTVSYYFPTGVGALRALNGSATINATYPDSPSNIIDDLARLIYIKYDVESDATYTLYRKQMTLTNGVTLPTPVQFDWVAVPETEITRTTGINSETLRVTIPEARVAYNYRVEAIGTGPKAGYQRAIWQTGDTVATSVRLRNSITPTGIGTASDWYNLAAAGYSQVGLQYQTVGDQAAARDPVRILYNLNLAGLTGAGSLPLLRADERIGVQLRLVDGNDNDTVYSDPVWVSRSDSWTGDPSGADHLIVGTLAYYFTVPFAGTIAVPRLDYQIRLVVEAK